MAKNDAEGKKLKKNLRLFSKKNGSSLRPNEGVTLKKDKSVIEQVGKTAEKNNFSKNDLTGHRKADPTAIRFDASEQDLPATKDSPAKQAFDRQRKLKKQQEKEAKKVSAATQASHSSVKSSTTNVSKSPTKRSNLAHIFTGVLIASALLTLAFLWPYLPFNREQVAFPGTGPDGLDRNLFSEERDDVIDGRLQIDDNGFTVIDDTEDTQEVAQPDDQPIKVETPLTAADEVTPPIVITSDPKEVDISDDAQDSDTSSEALNDATITESETQPEVVNPDLVTTYTPPVSTVGTWGLLNLNTETFELDDEDDDVTKIYLKDVCKSVYRQNPNAYNYCRETSKLKKSSSETLGAQRCGGGGNCTVGDTCLLWNSDEQSNGDLKSYTATYLCE